MPVYDAGFVARVDEVYGDWPHLKELMEQGAYIVGRLLDDGRYGGVSSTEILEARDLTSLQAKARMWQRRNALYAEWCDKYSGFPQSDIRNISKL